MASLTDIRVALRDTIASAIDDLSPYNTVPEAANLPAWIVVPRTTDFFGAMGRGLDTYEFDGIVLVSRRDDELAQYDLDEFINGFGSKSIRQAVWNNRTLGLTDGTEATVVGMSDYGAQFPASGLDHVGAVLRIRVTTSGTA